MCEGGLGGMEGGLAAPLEVDSEPGRFSCPHYKRKCKFVVSWSVQLHSSKGIMQQVTRLERFRVYKEQFKCLNL